jgi:peroxiredoxin
MRIFAYWAVLALATRGHAMGETPTGACRPSAAMEALSPNRYAGMSLSQSDRSDKISKIRGLLAISPDDLFLNRWLVELQPKPYTGNLAAEFRAKLADHPDDPRYIYLYARALIGKDTPSAIQFIRQAITRYPKLPWTYLALAEIYSSAAFRDPAQVAANLRAYHQACPANLDAFERLNVIEDELALRELAGKLRALLRKTTGPQDLRYYKPLWTAEFRLAPASGSEPVKAAVIEDLKRIETLSQGNDPAVLLVLNDGYRLSDQPEGQKRTGERLTAARPRDPPFEAYQAWEKDHPRGSGQAERDAYREAFLKATADWVKRWPDNRFVWEQRRNALIDTRSRSADEWKQVADGLTRAGPDGAPPHPTFGFAQDWVAAGVMLPEAVTYLRDLLADSETSPPAQSDLIQGTIASDLDASHRPSFRFSILLTLAEAAIKLNDFDLAHSTLDKLRKWLDTDFKKYYDQNPMNFPDREGRYLNLMGRLAEAEGRKRDALAYYRPLIVNPWYMREYGDRGDKVRSLFKELGGTEESWVEWSQPQPWPVDKPHPSRGVPMMAWSALDRPLPAMRVPDAAGHTWTLSDFKGKTTFVFLWATWCGPCWNELPAMQELYDALKERHDVQAISLSMDENPTIVQRFMQERHFNFPVLVSKTYVEQVLPEVVLGQVWLVDRAGRVRLQRQNWPYTQQVWVDEALDKLNHPPR